MTRNDKITLVMTAAVVAAVPTIALVRAMRRNKLADRMEAKIEEIKTTVTDNPA